MCPGDVNLPGRTGSGFWCLVNWGRCSVFLCWFSVFWWRGRVQQTAAIRRRLRIAAESMRVARQLAHGFLRESAAGLSLSPPAMCHMLPVNHSRQEGGGVFLATAISVAHIQLCKYQPVYPLLQCWGGTGVLIADWWVRLRSARRWWLSERIWGTGLSLLIQSADSTETNSSCPDEAFKDLKELKK